jgi:hypothetical protein
VKTGYQIIEERAAEKGLTIPEGGIPLDFLDALGIPMVVECTGCEMTMCVSSAKVDDDLRTWCSDCASEPETVEDAKPCGCTDPGCDGSLQVLKR